VNRLAARHKAARSRATCDFRLPDRDGHASGAAEPSTADPGGPPPLTWVFFDLIHGQQKAILQLAREVDNPEVSE
jgi:hypothetical protein